MIDSPSPHLTEDDLSAHLDGQLDNGPALSHLEACASCQLALTALQETVALLQALPEIRPHRPIRVEIPRRRSWARWFTMDVGIRGLATAATALFVVFLNADLTLSRQPNQPLAVTAPFSATRSESVPRATPAAPPAAVGAAAAPQPVSAPARSAQPAEDSSRGVVESFSTRDSGAQANEPIQSLRPATLATGAAAVGLILMALARLHRRAP